jgi:hypothetical protein
VLFKVDFEKDHDKVKQPFLQQVLHIKGFNTKWREWIKKIVKGNSVGIRLKDNIGHYFQTRKGLRTGDPLSNVL